jgi:hypothetical protein
MIMEKHLIYNPITGEHLSFDTKEEIYPVILNLALELFYAQTRNCFYRVAKIDENGFETMENAEQPATADIPQDLLNQALQKLNENT